MQHPDIIAVARAPGQELLGYAHLAMAVGSEAAVDAMTQRLVNDGYQRLDDHAAPVMATMKVSSSTRKAIGLRLRFEGVGVG